MQCTTRLECEAGDFVICVCVYLSKVQEIDHNDDKVLASFMSKIQSWPTCADELPRNMV